MILEPVMMNAGIIHPVDGYLAGLKDLLHRHGALLTFDEVKTGLTVGPGGVTRLVGVTPDLVCLAKAMGGGVSTAAIGGTEEVMSMIADGTYEQVGTFNGNPLAMAAARAMLTEVLTPAAYAHLERLRDRMAAGLQDVIDRHDLPWQVVTAGAKGCISFLPGPDPQLPRLPQARRALRPGALAGAAQPRRVPAAVGQGRAVADVGAAHRRGRRPASSRTATYLAGRLTGARADGAR